MRTQFHARNSLLVAGVFSLLALSSSAQADWEKIFVRTAGFDVAYSVQQTTDGGYIITGMTGSFGTGECKPAGCSGGGGGGCDVYLVKTDASGGFQWENTFGGTECDAGESVQQTTDGGYIIAGRTYSSGAGGCDVYLIKTDASGIMEWERTFGGVEDDEGYSVRQTEDGGYIIAGGTYSFGTGGCDVYLVKTDASGIMEWQNTFGGADDSGYDIGYSVQQTTDGGYIIAGYANGVSSLVYLVKTNASGGKEWEKTFGPAHDEWGYSVQQTMDGGYIIAGTTQPGLSDDVYLVKTDAFGNMEWERTFGGSDNDTGRSVQQTTDGGYIIAGTTDSFGPSFCGVYLIKTDALGTMEWQRSFGGNACDKGYSVQQTTDEGYIIAGRTGYGDVYLVRVDPITPPVITAPEENAIFTVTAGHSVDFTVEAEDHDVIAELTVEPIPQGATFTWSYDANTRKATGSFGWVPGGGDLGTYPLTLRATDEGGLSSSISVTIVVEPNRPPAITAPVEDAFFFFTAGHSVDFTMEAEDPNDDAIAELTVEPMPQGARFTWSYDGNTKKATGSFQWVTRVGDFGTYPLTLTATDEEGLSSSISVTIVVEPNRPPVITAPTDGDTVIAAADELLSLQVTATDPDQDGVGLYCFLLPGTATFSSTPSTPGTTEGILSWTPGAGDVGTYTVIFSALDIVGGSTVTVVIDVRAGRITFIQPTEDTVVVRSWYEHVLLMIEASGPAGYGDISLEWTSNPALPPSFEPNKDFWWRPGNPVEGRFSWEPDVEQDAGTYHLTLRATADRLGPAVKSVRIDVLGDSDGDGIFDAVDTEPETFSSDFSDLGMDGRTSGTVDRGEQDVTITDYIENTIVEGGVYVKTDPSGGATPATVNACGGEAEFTLGPGVVSIVFCSELETGARARILSSEGSRPVHLTACGAPVYPALEPGEEINVFCGSATIGAITGIGFYPTIDIVFIAANDTRATVSLDVDHTLTFEPETFRVSAPLTNTHVVSVVVDEDDQRALPVAPGETVELPMRMTFTVNTEDDVDDGLCDDVHCSLREAIHAANAKVAPDTIAFDISGSGPYTIQPMSPLPTITDRVVLEGARDSEGTPLLELDGSKLGAGANGLEIAAGNSTVRGLVINRFGNDGIRLATNGGNRIEGNFIGTDVTGTVALGNGRAGVYVVSPDNTIGGTDPSARNVISGNVSGTGIYIRGAQASGNLIQGNFIGTDAEGTVALPNYGGIKIYHYASSNLVGGSDPNTRNVISGNAISGVLISGSARGNLVQGNIIGMNAEGAAPLRNRVGVGISAGSSSNAVGLTETGSGAGNLIAGNVEGVRVISASDNRIQGNIIHSNVGEGVRVVYCTENAILGNSIYSNGCLGIDLNRRYTRCEGVTPNDPGDGDPSPYYLQNFPVLTTVTMLDGVTSEIQGILNSRRDTRFRLEFFSNMTCDPSGYGEGETLFYTTEVTTDLNGDAAFTVVVPREFVQDRSVTATATDPDGNTSEFSRCIMEMTLPPYFSADAFYLSIPVPDGIAVREDRSLLVVNESDPKGVFVARRGDMFDLGDAFSTTGAPPFDSPDDILLHPDGTVFVTDGNTLQTLFKIPDEGGEPTVFVTDETISLPNDFNPFGIALAPSGFDGPNVDPGDLIVADNAYSGSTRAVWAINPSTAVARAIAQGSVFDDGPTQVAFSPDGRLFVHENYWIPGTSRIVILDAEGTVTPFLSDIPAAHQSLCIHPVTGEVYFGLGELGEIRRIPSAGGTPEVFASDLAFFQDIEFTPDGLTLFVSVVGNVIEITGPFFEEAQETPVGSDVVVTPEDPETDTSPVTLTFEEIQEEGYTSLSITSEGSLPPSGFELGDPPTYYELTTTAEFSDSIRVCIDYSGVSVGNEANLKLFHFEGGAWVDVTTSLDPINDVICGVVTSLSPFAVFEDTGDPEVAISVDTSELWPPNHKLQTVTATVSVSDNYPDSQVVLTSITSNEPDEGLGDGDKPGDIQGADLGTDDREFQLRAERSEEGEGRVYTITYTMQEGGTLIRASAMVTVPHDKGKDKGKGKDKHAKQALIPERYALFQNQPNPFNPLTIIGYALPEAGDVRLTIYTVTGQRVAILVSGYQAAGRYEVVWDGSLFADGVYFYRLEAGAFVETRRMLLLK